MKNDIYTSHASVRKQQRGISDAMIDMVLEYGCSEYHRGYEIVFLNKQAYQKISILLEHSSQLSGQITRQLISKLKKVYVVLNGGVVVTTALKHQHFKRARK